MPKIKNITCHKILNSRGDWTIETHVELDNGSVGIQAIPEGASKGENEAISIDVDKAIDVVTTVINDALKGEDPYEQEALDNVMISMDGSANKAHLGANSILSVSLAIAHAAAQSQGEELYEYLHELFYGRKINKNLIKFPTPLFNVLNGGKHAHNGLSFQEFMVIPSNEYTITESLELGTNIYHTLKNNLSLQGYDVDVGDEGGFAPNNLNPKKALKFIREAASEKYIPGKNVFFGMDVAAGSFYKNDRYQIAEENLSLDSDKLGVYYSALAEKYELIYVEDPFYERDRGGWKDFYKTHQDKFLIVGDDLVVTNTKYLDIAVKHNLINAVIVKPNQVGSLTETFDFIKKAREAGMSIVVSHRSGDTAEDTFIADLSVAVNAEFLKSGSPVRGERVAKYNRLLEIYSKIK